MHKAPAPDLLDAIHALLGTLEITLEDEAAALARNDIDALAQYTQDKHRLCRQLEGLKHALRHDGAGGDLLRTHPRWQAVNERFETCQALNRRNGMVVVRKRHDVATLLATLHGQTGGDPATYGRRGDPRPASGRGEVIASA